MIIDLLHIILSLSCIVLASIACVLFLYARRDLSPILRAADESAELFSRLDTYSSHLKSVYELPTFYGDETLKSLLEHTNEFFLFLQRYENIYSFTQPDLEQILDEVDEELEEKENPQEER